MADGVLPQLVLILILGVSAQWIAWRVGFPSILLLLISGIVAGPVMGWIQPDRLFGDLIMPVTSIAVAVILFEGGMSLHLAELSKVGSAVRNLVTLGAGVTWLVTSLAAYVVLDVGVAVSTLLGAILVVTGPTVIAPLLRHIRPTGHVGSVLKWEGIIIDPIGAVLAVLVFEVMFSSDPTQATTHAALSLFLTVVVGGSIGLAAGWMLVLLLERHWIADYLENAVTLMIIVGVFAASNALQHESGLLTVTVMGILLANQKRADVEHIVEFKENLQVLLLASLFIILAARLQLADLQTVLVPGLLFVAILVFVARPLSVLVSTLKTPLTRAERLFVSWMAPRGIVAAAVASVFALRLQSPEYAGAFEGAEILVPVTFITIISTVTIYGLSSALVARKLGLAESNPQGILFAGAAPWMRDVAGLLQREGYRVLLVDSNREHVGAARMAGLPAYAGSILADHALEHIELGGLGRLLAVTPNRWVNVLAVHRFARIFGKAHCFQLSPKGPSKLKQGHKYLHGRWLFDEQVNASSLDRLYNQGYRPKATRLSEEFDWDDFGARHGADTVSMFIKDEAGRLNIITADQEPTPQFGQTVIFLARDPEAANQGASTPIPQSG